jgi:hypothetical protein
VACWCAWPYVSGSKREEQSLVVAMVSTVPLVNMHHVNAYSSAVHAVRSAQYGARARDLR